MYALRARKIEVDLIHLFEFIKSLDTDGTVFYSNGRTRSHILKLRKNIEVEI